MKRSILPAATRWVNADGFLLHPSLQVTRRKQAEEGVSPRHPRTRRREGLSVWSTRWCLPEADIMSRGDDTSEECPYDRA